MWQITVTVLLNSAYCGVSDVSESSWILVDAFSVFDRTSHVRLNLWAAYKHSRSRWYEGTHGQTFSTCWSQLQPYRSYPKKGSTRLAFRDSMAVGGQRPPTWAWLGALTTCSKIHGFDLCTKNSLWIRQLFGFLSSVMALEAESGQVVKLFHRKPHWTRRNLWFWFVKPAWSAFLAF